MKKKIAVTGEGPTDYGQHGYQSKTGQPEWKWGPVRELCILCMTQEEMEEIPEFYPVHKEDVKRIKLLRSDSGLEGRAIPARKFRNLCREQKLEYGIFYSDADRGENSGKTVHSAEKHFEKIYREVMKGLQADERKNFIPMVPLKMIECWLLGDEKAFYKCFGKIPKLPLNPELIWGDKEKPDSDYPKCYMNRALRQASGGKADSEREIFCELVENMDVETLKEKCAISFRVFYRDFRKLYESLTGLQK